MSTALPLTRQQWGGITDREGWIAGPWDSEPLDKVRWTDEATGLPCIARRGPAGAWCGYVGVPEGHPLFGVHYSDDDYKAVADLEVHGGITYTAACDGDEQGAGICHPSAVDAWWFGFDTGHGFDVIPRYHSMLPSLNPEGDACRTLSDRWDGLTSMTPTYKTLDYVIDEVTSLAKQLA